jgi:hypothetical protein
MLAGRLFGKPTIVGVILYAISLVAITGCDGTMRTEFTGHYDASCNCCKPGGSDCKVVTFIVAGAYEVVEYTVDLR